MNLKQFECLLQIARDYDYGWGQTGGLKHAEQVIRLALNIFDEFPHLGLPHGEMSADRILIQAAGHLHDIGRSRKAIGKGEHNEKGFETIRRVIPQYMTRNLLVEDELGILLYCVLFHRAHDFSERSGVPISDPQRTKQLAAILRIADGLDHGPPFDAPVRDLKLGIEGDIIICQVFPRSNSVQGHVKDYVKHTELEKVDLFQEVYGPIKIITGQAT
ncbi:HD domain-containing protein [Chloroflexota bacterium]